MWAVNVKVKLREELYNIWRRILQRINGVVVTWVVAIDPPGVRFPLNALA